MEPAILVEDALYADHGACQRQAGAGPRISLTWRAIRPQADVTAAHPLNTSET